MMITDWLPANSLARWRALSSAPTVGRALVLLGLSSVIILTSGLEILSHYQPQPWELIAMAILPGQLFSVWLYVFWWYPLRVSRRYPQRPRHGWLLFLIIAAFINTSYVFNVGVSGGGDPWVLIILFMMMATPCGALRWQDSVALLALVNLGLFHWLLPETSWHIGLHMMASQGVMVVLFRGLVREVSRTNEARLRVMELQATQELLQVQAQSETRHAIGQDLHDELGHLTTVISNNLNAWLHAAHQDSAREPDPLIKQSAELMQQLQREARRLSHQLQGRAFDLQAGLAVLQQQVQAISIDVVFEGFDGHCDALIGEAVFRACQESLTNAIRHSDATQLRFVLRYDGQWLAVLIQDNGSIAKAFVPGNGLKGIKQRLQRLGGECHMHCGQDGFVTELKIPM